LRAGKQNNSAFGDFVEGFCLPAKAYKTLSHTPGMRTFALMPIFVNVLIFIGIISFFFYLVNRWDIPDVEWNFWGSSVINYLLETFKWVILVSLGLVASYYSFTMIGLVVASPFNDILSERVERSLCEKNHSTSLPIYLTASTAALSTFDSLRITLRQLFFTLLALPFLFIPFIGYLPFFFISAWFSGLGFLDVGMARNLLRDKHKKGVISEHKWKILGLGMAMELLFWIPFLNLFLLPFGVVAGTHLYCTIDWEKQFEDHNLQAPPNYKAPKLLHPH